MQCHLYVHAHSSACECMYLFASPPIYLQDKQEKKKKKQIWFFKGNVLREQENNPHCFYLGVIIWKVKVNLGKETNG